MLNFFKKIFIFIVLSIIVLFFLYQILGAIIGLTFAFSMIPLSLAIMFRNALYFIGAIILMYLIYYVLKD